MECIWPLGALLGEGPCWDADAQAIRFVDIRQGRIHRCDVSGGARATAEVGGMPCFVLPIAGGDFVVGNIDRLQRFDGETITGEIARVPMHTGNRFNDATVDPLGRLWFGSMDNGETKATGAVHVHDGESIAVAGGACVITNGPAVSADGHWLYHVDTVAGIIWRFDISAAPVLANGEMFARIDPADGHPDGVTIDAEDHVWVGLWDGWAARRYAPDGTIAATVRFPCANITKLAFGGADLRTAFATTARIGLDEAALTEQPLAGGLFAFRVEVPGVVVTPARIG